MVLQLLQNLAKNYLTKQVVTDNLVFRLHYQVTVIILVVFGTLATSNQLFGRPIHCSTGQKNVNQDFVNAYCWTHPTFTVKQTVLDQKVVSFSDSSAGHLKFSTLNLTTITFLDRERQSKTRIQ